MTVSRPMLWFSVAFVAGMYLFACFGATVAYTVIFCAITAAICKGLQKKKLYDNLILILCAILFITGAVRFAICDDVSNKKLYPYINQPLTLSGEIIDDPQAGDGYVRILLKTDAVKLESKQTHSVSETIYVTCFTEEKARKNLPLLQRGDVVSLHAVLTVPDREKNSGGFDYAAYLKTKQIYFQATGEGETVSVTGHKKHFVSDFIYVVRQHGSQLLDTTFPPQTAGVLKAYILGDDSGIDDQTANSFSASGLSHALAISGMHVAVFLSIITVLLKAIHISKRKQLLISLLLVVLFVAFTGMSVSAIRAGFVIFIAIFAQLLFRRSDPVTALFEAAALICLWNPMSILSASFMLSFSATLGILCFSAPIIQRIEFLYKKFAPKTYRRKIIKGICDGIAIGFSAQVFTIPILIHLFQAFSTTSIIATIFIMPVLAPLLVGGMLFCLIATFSSVVAVPVAGFVYFLTKYMVWIADAFAAFPMSRILHGGITPFFLLCYGVLLALLYAILHRKRVACYLSACSFAALSVLLLWHTIRTYPIAEVSFINVGQGDCALVQLPGNCDILIDAGGKEGTYSIAENTVYPYLLQKGAYDIEYAFASHGHADHINGIIGLMELTKIHNLVVPEGFGSTDEAKLLLEKAKEKRIPVLNLSHGKTLKFGDCLTVTAIMPDEKILSLIPDDENNCSLVLKLEYGNTSFLFSGDISAKGAGYAASVYGNLLHADVLKAAHHGSGSSNSESFLDAVSPDYMYIPVGKNSYGHPNSAFLNRLAKSGITYYRADQHRDVTFYLDKTRICGIYYQENYGMGG